MVSISLEGVTKKFGDFTAVDSIDLEVKDKEFLVLLGPSGSGKTSTLNMLAGFEKITDGKISFDGEVMNDIVPEHRDVAMVFQSYALYPTMTAFNNIAFPLKIKKKPKLTREEIKEKVTSTAGMMGIAHLLDKKPYALSGGERQRVALARAIVREPRVFLMDEPLSNLDAKLRVHMRSELIKLQKELDVTTVYVTHDQVEAMSMAHRIAVMNLGKIVQLGQPLDIFDHPRDLFVAGFVGTPPMNLFDCSIVKMDSGVSLKAASFTLKLPKDMGDAVSKDASDSEVVLGVRPIDMQLSTKKEGDEGMDAEIYAVEPLGTETIVSLTIGEQDAKAITGPQFKAKLGEKTWVSVDKKQIHVFDKKTEKNLV